MEKQVKRFFDAFIENKAPYTLDQRTERRIYLQEAYTDEYMIRSDKTGHLCRYVVETSEGRESLYGFYGFKKTAKDPVIACLKVLERMTSEERFLFSQTVFEERFSNEREAIDGLAKYGRCSYRLTEPEKYAFCNKYLGVLVFSLIKN